jgi:hypothetical protein
VAGVVKQRSIPIRRAFLQILQKIPCGLEEQIDYFLHNVGPPLPLELSERLEYLVVDGFVNRWQCGHQRQMVSLDSRHG